VRLFAFILILVLANWPAGADYRILRDYGGVIEEYKAKYAKIRDSGERVIIDGECNSACTLVLGIVPLNRICVTPRASLGFHLAYYDDTWTFGIQIMSYPGSEDMWSLYPQKVKRWIERQGGLDLEMKEIRNGPELWEIVSPCPEEFNKPPRRSRR